MQACLARGRRCKWWIILRLLNDRCSFSSPKRWNNVTIAHDYREESRYGDAAVLYERNIAKINGSALWTYEKCSLCTACLGICFKKSEQYSDAGAVYNRSI